MKTARRQGAAVILALGGLMLLGIFISALAPLASQEVRSGMQNRELLEVQNVAEAGAKRAIALFYQTSPVWSWLDQPSGGTNWRSLVDGDTAKQYHVTITKDGNQIIPSYPLAGGTYYITSTGKVGTVTKTVTTSVTVAGIDPTSPFYYTLYAGNGIHFRSGAINGSDYAAEKYINIRQGGSAKEVSYDVYKKIILPAYDQLTSSHIADRPILNLPGGTTLTSSYSYKTIVVNGNLTIGQNTNLDNVSIYVTGNITFEAGGVNLNNNCFIVSQQNIQVKNDINVNLGQSVVVAYGIFDENPNSTVDINGTIVAGKNLLIQGNGNVNYNKGVVKYIFDNLSGSNGAITVGNWSSGKK